MSAAKRHLFLLHEDVAVLKAYAVGLDNERKESLPEVSKILVAGVLLTRMCGGVSLS
jgi:hypothetical protein